jgi:quercetin dioxygenase-like cupin family protein
MENSEVEKSKVFTVAETLGYIPDSVASKTIMKRITGNVMAVSFDAHGPQVEKISAFDTFIQVIDGSGFIVIDDNVHRVDTGQSIIVPAHSRSMVKPDQRFKMLVTVIKSGYEE